MIVESACLIGKNCKYNGGNNDDPALRAFLADKEYITVCPEESGGLPTPRPPVELKDGKAVNCLGEDKTAEFHKGAEAVLRICEELRPELVILKEASPSCGVNCVYDGTFTHTRISGSGMTAALLRAHGYRVISEKDLDTL